VTKLTQALKVARFMNLLAADGVRPVSGDVVAVMHGKGNTDRDGRRRLPRQPQRCCEL
jgi:hypothetical protein